jgi:hypothetical protein
VQSPSETDSRSAGEEIICILWNQSFVTGLTRAPTETCLIWFNLVNTLTFILILSSY